MRLKILLVIIATTFTSNVYAGDEIYNGTRGGAFYTTAEVWEGDWLKGRRWWYSGNWCGYRLYQDLRYDVVFAGNGDLSDWGMNYYDEPHQYLWSIADIEGNINQITIASAAYKATRLYVADKRRNIPRHAFSFHNFQYVFINSDGGSVAPRAFMDCDKLRTLDCGAVIIDSQAFLGCDVLDNVNLTNSGSVVIYDKAFQWSSIKTVTMWGSVEAYGDPFYECNSGIVFRAPKDKLEWYSTQDYWKDRRIISIEDGLTLHEFFLKSLTVNGVTLSPAFNSDILVYNGTVPGSTASITINAIAGGSIEGTGTKQLNFGNNVLNVTVSLGSAQRVYTVNIYRKSNDATLKTLSITSGTLSPALNLYITDYRCTVPGSTSSITINAQPNNSLAEVANTDTGTKSLNFGDNTFPITVTAEDGTVKTYNVIVHRSNNDATLRSLSITSGTLSPAFNSSITDYQCTVPGSTTSIIINAQPNNSLAVVSNTNTGTKLLNFGDNTFPITVTAEDGTIKTYNVIVHRSPISVTSIQINNPIGIVVRGDIWTVNYTVFPDDAIDKTVEITCNSQGVEQLNDSTFKFNELGYKTVTVQSISNPDVKDSCKIYVRVPVIPVTSIKINNPIDTIEKGGLWFLDYTVLPSDAFNLSVTYNYDSGVSVIQVYLVESPVFVFNESGYKTVTVQSVSNPDIKDSCRVYVREPVIPITSVKINNPPSGGIAPGDIWTVDYTVFPDNATDKTVEIICNSQGVEQLNDSTFKFNELGYKTVTVQSISNPDIKDSCRVHVRVPVTSIRINNPPEGLVTGDIWTVDYTVFPDDAADKTVEVICNSQGVEQLNDNTFKFNESGYKEIIIISVSNPNVKATCRLKVKSTDISLKEKYVNIIEGDKVIKIPLNPSTYECAVIVPSRGEYEIVMIPNDSAAVVGDVINVSPTVFTRTVTAEAGNSVTHYFTINQPPIPVERIIINNAPLFVNGNTWIVDYTVLPDDASDKRVKISVILGDGVYVDGNRLIFNTSGLKCIEIVSVANPDVVVKHNFYVDLNRTGIDSVSEKNQTFRVFTVTGREIPKPEPGKVSIFKYDSGRVEKVFVSSENK